MDKGATVGDNEGCERMEGINAMISKYETRLCEDIVAHCDY